MLDASHDTASAVEAYIAERLFDPRGLMYSGIDSHTGRPFEWEFITPLKVPRRAEFDPWSYWTYEDSVLTMGLYLDGLVLQHEVTGDSACLERAGKLWGAIEAVYSCSQVYGLGSFLRPYGGFERMGAFMEPLGTDQASPLFSGLYRYLPYAEAEVAADMRRVMLNTLAWYEQQGFKYFYYKAFIHSYAPHAPNCTHANSYYLPALAWAAQTCPEDPRWQRHLDQRLGYFVDGQYQMYPPGVRQPAFCWGSDMDVLHQLLGARFDEVFGPLLDGAYHRLTEVLAGFSEPGTVERLCPESAEPGFQPSVAEAPEPELDPLGFAYFRTRHQGRARPRQEIDFMIALAAIGYRTEETAARGAELLALSQAVPADFSEFLAEDYDRLPETVHLYARSIGVNMVEWWRDYWLLRKATQERP